MEAYLAIVGAAVFLCTVGLFIVGGGAERLPPFLSSVNFVALTCFVVGIWRWAVSEKTIPTLDVSRASGIGAGVVALATAWCVVALMRYKAFLGVQTHVMGPANFLEDMKGTNPTHPYMIQAEIVAAELRDKGLADKPYEVIAAEDPGAFTTLLEAVVAMGDRPANRELMELVPPESRGRILDAAEHATRNQVRSGIRTWRENVEILHSRDRLRDVDVEGAVSEADVLRAEWKGPKIAAWLVVVASAVFALVYSLLMVFVGA